MSVDRDRLLRGLVELAARLREAGVALAPLRVPDAATAVGALDEPSEAAVYWALRCTLTSRKEDIEVFDAVYGRPGLAPVEPAAATAPDRAAAAGATTASADGDAATAPARTWSGRERLAELDLAAYGPDELREAQRLMAGLVSRLPPRTTRRLRPSRTASSMDLRRTLRRAASTGGVPLAPAFRAPAEVPRRWLAILDVSGSMAAQARPMLLFLHALAGAGEDVEAFTFGTRLTRVTPSLRDRRPGAALAATAAAVPDWSGGTRIGDALSRLLARWEHLARGAIVVVLSDGWDRGDPALVATATRRLHRHARLLVWANPLAGEPGFRPLAGGMAAALPHVDRLVPAATLADLAALPEVVGAALRGRRAAGGRDAGPPPSLRRAGDPGMAARSGQDRHERDVS